MKKRKILLVVAVIFIGHWLISNTIELYGLIKKYPKEFKQQGDFSYPIFYNTYRTLSFSERMVERGYTSPNLCFQVDFLGDMEKRKLLPSVKEEYLKAMKVDADSELGNNITTFMPTSINCIKDAKLINFELKCREAYATYSCQVGDDVNEFSYTGNQNEKCSVIDYKKSWGVKPLRTQKHIHQIIMTGPGASYDNLGCDE